MSVLVRQANFMLPEDLLNDLKQFVGQRQQSRFVAEAVRKELRHEKMKNALKVSFGAWKDEEHPEFKDGVDLYIREQRRSTRSGRNG
jgi:hypothetical protein